MRKIDVTVKHIRVFVAFMALFYFGLISETVHHITLYYSRKFLVSFVISIIALLVYLAMSLYCISIIEKNIAWKKHGQLEKQKFERMIQLAEQSEKNEENILRLHHDMKNHLGVVCSLLGDEKQEEAEKYVRELQMKLHEETGINDK